MTVFVVQKPKPGPNGHTYDVSPAQEYGDVKFILDAYDNPSSRPLETKAKIEMLLRSCFKDEEDFLVWAGGDPYALMLTGFVVANLGYKIRWLRWERLRQPRSTASDTAARAAGYYVPVDLPQSAYLT